MTTRNSRKNRIIDAACHASDRLPSAATMAPRQIAKGTVKPLGPKTGPQAALRNDSPEKHCNDLKADAGVNSERIQQITSSRTGGKNMDTANRQGDGRTILSQQIPELRASKTKAPKKKGICHSAKNAALSRANGGRNAVIRRGSLAGTNIESSTPSIFKDTGANTDNKEAVIKRLSNAAAHFWPRLSKDERSERVHTTLIEILAREKRDEFHKISWWAKWMFRRTHDLANKFSREMGVDDIAIYSPTTQAEQITSVSAHEAIKLLEKLPTKHKRIFVLLCDGANPVEISDELSIPITDIIFLIREARGWLADGGCYLG